MKTVCIIGGGFSGCLTAIHLLNKSSNVKIKLINHNYPLIQGIAYSTNDASHLLNVPAGKMSAFADKPFHFTEWLSSKKEFKHLLSTDIQFQFLPRFIYGAYLKEMMDQYLKHDRLTIISSKATGVKKTEGEFLIQCENASVIESDALVLAMGNYLPAEPRIENSFDFSDPAYFKNPWDNSFLNEIDLNKNILIIGTGLTMIDCVRSLAEINFKAKIIAVSPRGYIPARHSSAVSLYTDFFQDLKNKHLLDIFKIIRFHIKRSEQEQIPWQAVIDVIRPLTKEIWLNLSVRDKKQFISHLRHIWGVARHRLPETVHNKIMELMDSGQLQVIGGRLNKIEKADSSLKVTIKLRRKNSERLVEIDRIVNCTGPQSDFNEINDALIKDLLQNKIIFPDELKLGIKASPEGKIIDHEGTIIKNAYAIGSLLRGVLWETTAIPELRVNTENVADQIVNTVLNC